jgi:secondary thiamine-phosphate synthase enzyme
MKSHTHYLWFTTKQRQELIDVTDQVAAQVAESGVVEGFVLVSAMHITASVFVNDHESGLWHDILKWLEETVAPWDPARYRHNETGEDNAAAHLRSLTIGHEVIVPITAAAASFRCRSSNVKKRRHCSSNAQATCNTSNERVPKRGV